MASPVLDAPPPTQPHLLSPSSIVPFAVAPGSYLPLSNLARLACFAQPSRDLPLPVTALHASPSREDRSDSPLTGQPLADQAQTTSAASHLCHHLHAPPYSSSPPQPTAIRYLRSLARYRRSPGNSSRAVVVAPRRWLARYATTVLASSSRRCTSLHNKDWG